MRKFLFSLGLVAILSLAACQNNAKQPASPTNAKAPTIIVPKRSVPKIVAFGDSLTAGYGLQPPQSYPALLEKRLQAEGYEYEVINAGISGDTSSGGVRRLDWSLEPDVRFVILELGANDILRLQPVEQMKENLGLIIEGAKAKGAIVLLAGMEAPTNSGPAYRKAVHEAFLALAKEHQIELIPFFLEGVAGQASLNQGDNIHPNAEGTKLVADNVFKYLKPLLDKEKAQMDLP